MSEAPDQNQPADADAPVADPPASDDAAAQPVMTAVFSPRRLEWQLRRDRITRWLPLLVIILLALTLPLTTGSSWESTLIIMLVIGSWLLLSLGDARAAAALPRLTMLIEVDAQQAENELARLLRRWPLQRSIRLMLCHRLAALRHQQQRYGESAQVCQTVLAQPMGRARRLRPHLLLMLAEAQLNLGDLWGAYDAIIQAHRTRLSLVELLQLLALQTRYELATGQPEAAVRRIEHKVQLAELMPAPQAGMTHYMLGCAAEAVQREDLARHLLARAQLLANNEQLEHIAHQIGQAQPA